MNFSFHNPWVLFRLRRKIDLQILNELLDYGADNEVLKEILNLNLNDENHIRGLLNKPNYLRYLRLCATTDKRKALRVILKSIKLQSEVKLLFLKQASYPVFLFFLSGFLLMFIDRFLVKTFQTMLAFLGPSSSNDGLRALLQIVQGTNGLLLGSAFISLLMLRTRPLMLYQVTKKYLPNSLWSRWISHEFCQKFMMFYQLGSNIDEIFSQIKDSADPVLADRCAQSLQDLQQGAPLHEAVARIDFKLSPIFQISSEGLDLETYLLNHNQIQESLIARQIRVLTRSLLAFDYLQIGLIIIVIYQMMLKPIEMMEHYL